jgi:tetratricopeptide (TPR) repeat protein
VITSGTTRFPATRRAKLALGLALILVAAIQPLHAADSLDPDGRLFRLERWIGAALAHRPGAQDQVATEVGQWSNAELRVLLVDELMLLRAMRMPQMRVPARASADRSIPTYTPWQLRQFRELVVEYRGRNRSDDIMVRGAVLHGDVAMSNRQSLPTPVQTGGTTDLDPLKVLLGDGESIGLKGVAFHWDMARAIFDELKDNRQASDVARRWYIATSMWMQNKGQHDTLHLRHGRNRFPQDIDLQFLSGCQQEMYASPAIQVAARTAVLPVGYYVDVASDSAALRDAEEFFRRVLALNPEDEQAQLHLGHVLLLRGRPQEAANELRQLRFDESEGNRRYFAALFLGAAEEGAGRLDEAREAYSSAAALVPLAQSPYLALSALAARRGDRATALKEIARVFELRAGRGEPEDPWWAYDVDHTRNVDLLLEKFSQSIGAPE